MRTAMLSSLVCGLLFLTGSLHAAPPAEGAGDKVSEYVKALKSKNAAVRKQVALALGDLGDKAKLAVPALREALLDADEEVQGAAAKALEKIGGRDKASAEADADRKRLAEENAQLRKVAEAERDHAEKLKKDLTQIAEEERAQAQKLKKELSELLEKSVRDKDDTILKLQAELDKSTKARIEAEIGAKSLQNRNAQLVRQVEELSKEIARLKTSLVPDPPKKNPPPKDVEGTILKVEGNLVMISIGSDAGLEKGHTLEVYRLKPSPTYVGQIRIVDLKAKEAVGSFVGKPKTPVQEGDTVSSELLPREKK